MNGGYVDKKSYPHRIVENYGIENGLQPKKIGFVHIIHIVRLWKTQIIQNVTRLKNRFRKPFKWRFLAL